MRENSTVALIAAFVVVFFATGIPYWQIPYSQASLPNSLYGVGLAVVFAGSAAVRLACDASFKRTVYVTGSAVPAMVLTRVVVETFKDPTSHNLWPFEIIIASGVGFSVALAGALLGGLVTWALRRD
jgi:hypothetical protein